jgi:hypothetical protein
VLYNLAIQIATTAAQGFKNLECVACAEKVIAALVAAGENTELIELRTVLPNMNIVCESDAFAAAISENGYHCGVRVEDMMFDNLRPNGTPYAEWINSFEAVGGLRPPTAKAF